MDVISTLNQNPVAGSPALRPADLPAKADDAFFDKLKTYQSTDTPAVAPARVKRGTTDCIIKGVGNSLESIVNNDRVRGELDKVIEALKGADVREIKINSYYAFLSERTSHAKAVAAYFVSKGVDESLITAPGDVNANVKLARSGFIRVEIVGSVKQSP